MKTDDLVERIARDARPVTPLRPAGRSGVAWAVGTTGYLAVLVAVRALLLDGSINGLPPLLLFAQVAAIATGVGAAVAAFTLVIPGESRRVLAWPITAGFVWVASLLVGTVREWPIRTQALQAPHEWLCVAMIGLGSLLPVAVMLRALRRGAPLAPGLTVSLTVLAAAGLANVGACVAHPHTSGTVLLLWHGATIAALVVVGAALGRSLLVWRRPAFAP
jgi:hypothetical protein